MIYFDPFDGTEQTIRIYKKCIVQKYKHAPNRIIASEAIFFLFK
jgi:hypothetical protein